MYVFVRKIQCYKICLQLRTLYCTPLRRNRRRSDQFKLAYFVTNDEWASKIAQTAGLMDNPRKNSTVLELNPGNGPLSRYLLTESRSRVIAWEPRAVYWDHLGWLADQYPKQFEYRKKHFVKETTFTQTASAFSTTESSDCGSWPTHVVGNVECMRDFVPLLVYQMARQHGVWQTGNVVFNLIVNGLEYRLMTEASYFWQKRSYLRTALYDLFFDCSLVMKIPLLAFNYHSVTERNSAVQFDCDNMFLMKLIQKQGSSCISSTSYQSKVIGLVRLLKWINCHRRHRVIPTLDSWCPDIGLDLIDANISMMDTFCDLPAKKWPEIYNILILNKHYPYSPLKHLLEDTEKLHIGDSKQDM